jgi:hypothetical protein
MTAGSGPTLPDCLGFYDRDTRSWKMSQGYLPLTEDTHSVRLSVTWPTSGMTRSGRSYPLPTWARRTSASASGLWPTALADGDRTTKFKQGGPPLVVAVRQWPTPMAADATQQRTPEEHYRRQAKKKAENPNLNELHKPLITAVLERRQAAKMWPTPDIRGFTNDGSMAMLKEKAHSREEWSGMAYRAGKGKKERQWPTPTARDWKDGSYCPNVPVNGLLGRAVWPTPTAGDASGSGNRNNPHSKAHAGVSLTDAALTGDSSTPRSEVSGSLNPTWVEWLMGYPSGWTDLEDSETPLFHKL